MKLPRIINSLLETDLYKFSMGQAIYHQFPSYETIWSFKCRNTDVKFTEEMVEDLTFDRLMFTVKTQAELDGILDVFPSDAPLAIDPSSITENLTIPLSRKVFVQLSEADAVRLKAKGFAIIFR